MTAPAQPPFMAQTGARRPNGWWLLLLAPAVGLAVFLAAQVLDDEYASTARFLPPSLFSVPTRLAIFPGDSLNERLADQLSIRYQSDMALTVLKSAPVMDDLITTLNLSNPKAKAGKEAMRDRLQQVTQLSASRDGVIAVTVTDTDPQQAARMANAYVDALERYVVEFTAAAARKRASVLDQQLLAAQGRLVDAERVFAQIQARSGILRSDGQVSSQVNNVADLRQRLAVRESQLSAMAAYSTPGNPGYQRVQAEVRGLQAQIDRIVGGPDAGLNPGRRAGALKDDDIEFQHARREVKAFEELVDSLRKQAAQAQFDQAAQVSGVQVIERAMPPERRSGPRRALMAVIAALVTLAGLLAWFFVNPRRLRRHAFAAGPASAAGS